MSKKRRTQRELTPIEKQVEEIIKRREDFTLLVAFSELALELQKTDKMIQEMDDSPEKLASLKKQEEAWELLMGKDMFGKIASEA